MSFQLVGQSLSTLVSTSFQHVSACRRCHSFTEAVYLALLSFLGLISSFHNNSPVFGFFILCIYGGQKNSFFPQPYILYRNPPFSSSDFPLFLTVVADFSVFFYLVVHFDGHHQILATVCHNAFYRVRRHRRVEGKHRFFTV